MRQRRAARAGSWCAAAVLVVVSVVGFASASPRRAAGTDTPVAASVVVVVVAIPGLSWSDVTASGTPGLWAFAGRASRGLLSVKAAETHARCAAGMTTLGAGNRAVGTAALEARC